MSDLNFSLHEKQLEIFNSDARFKVCAAGRRGGKSYLSAVTLLLKGLEETNRWGYPLKGKEVWYVAPTFQQGKDIMWNLLKDIGEKVIKQAHENTARLTLINGRTIQIKGSDRPDTLRGVAISYVVMDEYAFMKPEVWDLIISPTLADVEGDALFIGTPDGKNHFYELWVQGHKLDEWESFSFNSMDNPMISQKEIEKARGRMSADAFRQEFEASFSSGGGGSFKESMFQYATSSPEAGDIYIAVDPAGFGTGTGMVKSAMSRLDEMAIAVVEVSPSGWFVHDMIHGRWGVREASLQVIKAAQKYRPRCVGIEGGSLKNAMGDYLHDQMRRLNIYPRIETLTHGGKKKTERITWALQGRFEHGRIIFKEDAPWLKKLTDQLLDFPNPMSHDDLPDALAYIDQLADVVYADDFEEETWEPLDPMAGF